MPQKVTIAELEEILTHGDQKVELLPNGEVITKRVDADVTICADEYNRLREIESRVVRIVSQRGDNFCWRDAYTELSRLVGKEFCPELICDPEKHLANCCEFIHSLRTGGKYDPIFVERRDDDDGDNVRIVDMNQVDERMTLVTKHKGSK